MYVPARYEPHYAPDGALLDVVATGAPAIVTKRRLGSVDSFRTIAAVKTPNAEYGHMALLEVGKGCGRGCRFCLEGQVYRPVRHRSVDALRETVEQLAREGEKRVGLVGACVSDYPWIGELLKIVEANGMELSISSLRADSLTEDLASALARGGHRTLTIAPEAGTDRLRRVIRKAITDEQILDACSLVRAQGIPNLKTYFMIGQPTETAEDVEAIVDLARRMLERLRVLDAKGHPFGRLTLSISSFVPKPWTPFQWAPFDGADVAEPQAGDDQEGRPARSPTCGCCTRTRARRRCRPCWPAATGAWPTSWSRRRGWTATGAARCATGRAIRSSTRRVCAPRTSGCRGTTSRSA